MDFKEYQKESLRTWLPDLTLKDKIANLSMGLCGETGEVVDYLKKCLFHGKAFDVDNIILELGDLMWYISILMHELNISMDTVLTKNIAKLKERYPEGFKGEQ